MFVTMHEDSSDIICDCIVSQNDCKRVRFPERSFFVRHHTAEFRQ